MTIEPIPRRAADFSEDPLQDSSPEAWDRLVRALSPPAMLLCIRERMSADLLRALSPEDIWQETLIHVWRARGSFEWQGARAFRRFVLRVAENRIQDAVASLQAEKRGGRVQTASLDADEGAALPPPASSTTPSRVASYAEEAELLHAALAELPEDLREVVRLRLFEDLEVEDVAQRLALGVSAVKHRFRKGALVYQRKVDTLLARRHRSAG